MHLELTLMNMDLGSHCSSNRKKPDWKGQEMSFGSKNKYSMPFPLFQNAECYASESSGSEYGTCYTASECSDFGGTAYGTCAKGYGVCCICKCEIFCKETYLYKYKSK